MQSRLVAQAVLAAALLPAAGLAAQALPIGSSARGTASSETPASFRYSASGAGILTVVATSEADIMIAVTDEDGQELAGGTADVDHGGNVGHEFISVPLPEAGIYLVEVRSWDGSDGPVAFEITAGFVASAAMGGVPDPDRRPSRGNALAVGASRMDTVHFEEGDNWDWFTIRPAAAGTLVIVTRVAEEVSGDLAIEAYLGGNYREPVVRSDQDLQGLLGNESVTIDVKAGDVLQIRVSQLGAAGGPVPYRISVGTVP